MNAGSYEIGTYWKIQTELVNHDNIQPLLDELNKMLKFNSNRDARYFNESNLKTMLSAILYNNPTYVLKSELEFNGGYADVAILPDHVHQLNHYCLFELKYIPVGEALGKFTPADGVGDAAIEAKLREARAQLQRYMKEPLVSKLTNLHKYIIVASLRGVLKVEEMDE
jgi:hypothetical protein